MRGAKAHGTPCKTCGHTFRYEADSSCVHCRTERRKTDGYKSSQLRIKYGITLDDYKVMLEEQDNCCAICDQPFDPNADKWNLPHVDHCHATGTVRGLLCKGCNLGIGHLKDNIATLEAAILYLKETKS